MVRSEDTAEDSFAAIFARSKLGMAMAAMIRIIATTISNSIREKPRCLFIVFAPKNWPPKGYGPKRTHTQCTQDAKRRTIGTTDVLGLPCLSACPGVAEVLPKLLREQSKQNLLRKGKSQFPTRPETPA